ncbi:phage tail fiber protein [Nocardia sp. NPDC055321]
MAITIATTRQVLADAFKTLTGASTVYVSLHTADPTTVGNNEATGGSYARVLGTWSSGSGGVLTMAELTFNAPNGTFTHVGLWSASTSGTFYDKCALSPNITLASSGTIKVTPSFTLS